MSKKKMMTTAAKPAKTATAAKSETAAAVRKGVKKLFVVSAPAWKISKDATAQEAPVTRPRLSEEDLHDLLYDDIVAEEASIDRVQQMAEELIHLRRMIDPETEAAVRFYRAVKEIDGIVGLVVRNENVVAAGRLNSGPASMFDKGVIDAALEYRAKGLEDEASHREDSFGFVQNQAAWFCFTEDAKQAAIQSVNDAVTKLRTEAHRLRSMKLTPAT